MHTESYDSIGKTILNWFTNPGSETTECETRSSGTGNQCEENNSTNHQAVYQHLINYYSQEKECPAPWDRGVLFPDDIVGDLRIQIFDPNGDLVREDPAGLQDVLRSLWSSSDRPLRVLIRGGAGMGKTTLCDRIVLEWRKNDGMLIDSSLGTVLLVYFRLRTLTCDDDLETELLKFITGTSGSRFHKTNRLGSRTKNFRLILLLDGYNEANAAHQKQVEDLILVRKMSHFENSSVIVTSRSEVDRDFLVLFDKHFVLNGLSDKAADVLIRKYYHNSDCVVNFIMSKFRDVLQRYKMSPLLLVLLCYLQRHNYEGKVETFEQVVYQCALVTVKKTWQSRVLKDKKAEQRLNELGKHFLRFLREKKFLFSQTEVEKLLPHSAAFGLFRTAKCKSKGQNTLEVIHPRFMEVLAMHYVNELWYLSPNEASFSRIVPHLSVFEIYTYKDCNDELSFKVIGDSKWLGCFVWDFKDSSCIFSTCLDKSLIPRKMGQCKLNINYSLKLHTKKSFSHFFNILEKLLPKSPFLTQVSYLVSQFDCVPLQIHFLVNDEYQLCETQSEVFTQEQNGKANFWSELRDMANDINLTFLGKGCSHKNVVSVLRNLMCLDMKLEKETTQATELLKALKTCRDDNFTCTLAAVARLGQYYLVDTKRRYAFEDLRPWTKKKFFQPKYNWEYVDMFVISYQRTERPDLIYPEIQDRFVCS